MTVSSSDATILIVDDERGVADVYELKLSEKYSTEVAYNGTEALETIHDGIDAVLLDRRMPDKSGDEVLEEIRERELDCRVIMLTAVDPDFDIIHMPFDDYVCKPVDTEDLIDAIDQQLAAQSYDEQLTEYLHVTTKLVLLEEEKSLRELQENEDVRRLRDRARRLKDDLDQTLDEIDDIELAFREIDRTTGR
jgi:DNA-binding NtrC family response regulator